MTFFRMQLFAIALGLAMLAGCSMSGDTKLAEQAVTNFHQMLDAGQIDAIYATSSDDLKKLATREQFVTFMTHVHEKMGMTKSTTELNWHIDYNTSAEIVTLTYATVFGGGNAKESFVFGIQDGKALLSGYHIK